MVGSLYCHTAVPAPCYRGAGGPGRSRGGGDGGSTGRRVLYSAVPALICHAARPPMADPTGQPFSGFTQPLLVWRERELACLREALSS